MAYRLGGGRSIHLSYEAGLEATISTIGMPVQQIAVCLKTVCVTRCIPYCLVRQGAAGRKPKPTPCSPQMLLGKQPQARNHRLEGLPCCNPLTKNMGRSMRHSAELSLSRLEGRTDIGRSWLRYAFVPFASSCRPLSARCSRRRRHLSSMNSPGSPHLHFANSANALRDDLPVNIARRAIIGISIKSCFFWHRSCRDRQPPEKERGIPPYPVSKHCSSLLFWPKNRTMCRK